MTSDRQLQNTYDASTECELIFHCEELGRFVLRACRESSPVRWIAKQVNNGYFLKLALLDDQTETSLAHYSFRSPAESSPMSADSITGFRVSEGGGLFAAIAEKYRTAIIVPPAIHSLKWLSPLCGCLQASLWRSGACFTLSRCLHALGRRIRPPAGTSSHSRVHSSNSFSHLSSIQLP